MLNGQHVTGHPETPSSVICARFQAVSGYHIGLQDLDLYTQCLTSQILGSIWIPALARAGHNWHFALLRNFQCLYLLLIVNPQHVICGFFVGLNAVR